MNSVGAAFPGYFYDGIYIQIRFEGISVIANLVGFVGLIAVQRIPVLIGKNGHCSYFQLIAGSEYTDSNFAAVGDEQFRNFFNGHESQSFLVWKSWFRTGIMKIICPGSVSKY